MLYFLGEVWLWIVEVIEEWCKALGARCGMALSCKWASHIFREEAYCRFYPRSSNLSWSKYELCWWQSWSGWGFCAWWGIISLHLIPKGCGLHLYLIFLKWIGWCIGAQCWVWVGGSWWEHWCPGLDANLCGSHISFYLLSTNRVDDGDGGGRCIVFHNQ